MSDTVRILRDVVSALAYAHSYGVVHRDIKPDNVLLSHGVAVVTDFGVAKALSASSGASGSGITSAGVALGTPAYMSPEQATASPNTDHRADIYALGAMAYELLTGLPPFAGRTAQAVLAAHVTEEPEPVERRRPAVHPMLATLVRDCLCKRPADRPQSAVHVMNVLDAIVTPSGGTAATTAVRLPAATQRETSRQKWLIGSAAALAVLATGGLFWFRHEPQTADPRAAAVSPATDSAIVVGEAPDSPPALQVVPSPEAAPRPPHAEPARPRPATRRTEVVTPPRAQAVTPPSKDSAEPAAAEPAAAIPAPGAPTDTSPTAPPPVPAPPTPVVPRQPAITAPVNPPIDQRPAIRSAVAEYAAAVESRSLDALRRVYPAMTGIQQRGWEQFFQLVRDVKADLSLVAIQVSGLNAEGQITGSYTYLNTSTGRPEHQPVSFRATFRSEGGRWRVAQVR